MRIEKSVSLVSIVYALLCIPLAHALDCPAHITVKFSDIEAAAIDETIQKYPAFLSAQKGLAAQPELTSTLSLFDSSDQIGRRSCFYHDNLSPSDSTRVHYLWNWGESSAYPTVLNTWLVTPTGEKFGIGLYLDVKSTGEFALKPSTPARQSQLPYSISVTTLEDPTCEPIPVGDAGAIPCPLIMHTVGAVKRIELLSRTAIADSSSKDPRTWRHTSNQQLQ